MMQLANKIVLITGGGRGIGLELAKLCVADGATVLLADISEQHLSEAVEILRGGRSGALGERANVHGFIHDVTDRLACKTFAARIEREFGAVDVLVNNAGVAHKGDFLDGDSAAWKHTVDVNLNGLMWMMHAFMPAMVARKEGHVLNMASILGITPLGGLATYCATKHAVLALTEAVRFELLERGFSGVGLTTACPGFTDTGMFLGVKTQRVLSAVSAVDTAKAIYRAMKLRKRVVRYPHRYFFLPQAYALLPHWIWKTTTRLLGVHRAMDGHAAHAQLPSGQ